MQETNLTPQEIKDLIKTTVESAISDIKGDFTDFKRWDRLDSVTDQFSPITGASSQIGFFKVPKISQPTVTGSRGANAALTSLCTALANLGLIVNSTS